MGKTPTSRVGMVCSKNNGFTLFEILLVLTLLALAMISFIVLWPKNDITCARTIMAGFKLARFKAVSHKHPVMVVIDAKHQRLQIHDQNFTLPGQLKLEENTEQKIVFYPDGRNSGAVLVCRSGASALRLRLSILDGKINIQRI